MRDLETPNIAPELVALYQQSAIELLALPENPDVEDVVRALDVLRAHFVVVDFCRNENIDQGVGGIGPKSSLLLMSAVDRQHVEFGGKQKYPDVFHKISTLVFGLVKNHAFHDANKRTALLTLVYSLYKNGRLLTAEKNEIEDLLVYMAEDALHLADGFEEFSDSDDPVIDFFANYIRKNSRDEDKRTYIITYRELNSKLQKYGFRMENPYRNHIDIVRINDDGSSGDRVLRTGFPGWTRQVAKGDMRRVMDVCGLNMGAGIDSAVFFHEEDPIYYFASDYRAQLASLAFR